MVDSLTNELNNTSSLFEKAKLNLKLAKVHERIDFSKAKTYAYEALKYNENDSLLVEANNQLGRFHFFTAQLDSASFYFNKAKVTLKKLKDENRVAIINISLGAIQLRQGHYENTIKILTESATFFESANDELNAAKCYSNISSAFAELDNYNKAIEYSEKALAIFSKNELTQFQLITLPNLATQHFKKGDTIRAINYYNEAEIIAKSINDNRSLSIIYNNLGNIYLENNPLKSENYLKRALTLKRELNLNSGIEITKSNLGYIYLKKQDYVKAITLLKEAEPFIKGKQLSSVYDFLSKSHKGLGDYQKALMFSEKAKQLNDSLLSAENQNTILDIQTKYETEKKEKEILQLTADNLEANYKRRQNKNLLFIALTVLIFVVLGLYMYVKNTKRKRIIMEQNLTIHKQTFNQELKAKELEGIDAILDAQERERTKMAADLHDNLGSKVAALKLYLENYDETESFSVFYDKLKSLMNETYNEIRNIAKNKNFGAKIEKGLIPSTSSIAKQISESSKLDIKVINIDVEHRIENTLEIQLFRIIQELLTNIIKHANATEAFIQFSEDNNKLTVVIEDNGKGFNINNTRSGIGLNNIEKRAEKINAELVIDSSEGHGTTIILNIPL